MNNRFINNSPLPPPPLLQRQSQIFGLNRAIEGIMSINEPPKMESNNNVQSRHILNSLPSTPPSSSQRKRSNLQDQESYSSSTFTTTKLESPIKHQESPSPSPSPSKRKRSTTNGEEPPSNASPSSRKGGSKWLSWEDKIILKALISNGEKGIDWKGVLEEINSKRSKDEPRSMASVKLHWSTSMKVKLME